MITMLGQSGHVHLQLSQSVVAELAPRMSFYDITLDFHPYILNNLKKLLEETSATTSVSRPRRDAIFCATAGT
jgi:hypothetical protein